MENKEEGDERDMDRLERSVDRLERSMDRVEAGVGRVEEVVRQLRENVLKLWDLMEPRDTCTANGNLNGACRGENLDKNEGIKEEKAEGNKEDVVAITGKKEAEEREEKAKQNHEEDAEEKFVQKSVVVGRVRREGDTKFLLA